jgi:hypothetical protein
MTLNWRGNWSSSATYNLGDLAFINFSTWLSLTTNSNVNPTTDTHGNWALFAQGTAGPSGATGSTGASGQGLRWTGDYNSGRAYSVNECVGFSNSAFVCIAHTTPGIAPLVGGVHSAVDSHWSLMALGQPLIWQGAYVGGNTYYANDVVTYNGSTYVAITSSTNMPPTSTDNWALILSNTITVSQITATGTPSSSTFLRGDGAWATVVGGVTSVFGRSGAVTAQSGDYSVGQVTGAAPLASPSFSGTVTFPDSTTWASGVSYGTNVGLAITENNSSGTGLYFIGEAEFPSNPLRWMATVTKSTDSSGGAIQIYTSGYHSNLGPTFTTGGVVIDDNNGNDVIAVTAGGSYTVTPLTSDNSTRIATTAYVQAQGYVTAATAPIFSTAGDAFFIGPGCPLGNLANSGSATIAQTNAGTVGGNVVAIKFTLPYQITLRKVSTSIATTSASSTASFGIYDKTGTTLLVDPGTFDGSIGTAQTKTLATPVTIGPGVYWYAYTGSDTTVGWWVIPNLAQSTGTFWTTVFNNSTPRFVKAGNNANGNGTLPASLNLGTAVSTNGGNVPVVLFEA